MIRTSQETRAIDEFRATFDRCWACGQHAQNDYRNDGIDYYPWVETHHIQKRGRVHERWNLARLCKLCHDLTELHKIMHQGERLPNLTLEHTLWLKKHFDPDHYERPMLLRWSRTSFLPTAKRPPAIFEQLTITNAGHGW
jgi:hypothetical protein